MQQSSWVSLHQRQASDPFRDRMPQSDLRSTYSTGVDTLDISDALWRQRPSYSRSTSEDESSGSTGPNPSPSLLSPATPNISNANDVDRLLAKSGAFLELDGETDKPLLQGKQQPSKGGLTMRKVSNHRQISGSNKHKNRSSLTISTYSRSAVKSASSPVLQIALPRAVNMRPYRHAYANMETDSREITTEEAVDLLFGTSSETARTDRLRWHTAKPQSDNAYKHNGADGELLLRQKTETINHPPPTPVVSRKERSLKLLGTNRRAQRRPRPLDLSRISCMNRLQSTQTSNYQSLAGEHTRHQHTNKPTENTSTRRVLVSRLKALIRGTTFTQHLN